MEAQPIANAVGLSLAPIFLLAGIGGILSVITQRLGRIVDRARLLEGEIETGRAAHHAARYREELPTLEIRMTSANRAIYATTTSALFVCIVVALLFIEQLTQLNMRGAVAALFIATMLFLILGLVFFLREIAVATGQLHIRTELLREGPEPLSGPGD